jgi:hypothetical protein
VAENRRDEQKLWLILFQIKGIRTRLNFIALQRWLFTTLVLLIGGAAMVFLSATLLGPLAFLLTAALIVLFALTAMVRVARSGLRQHANPVRAASIADERSGLKGRLTTVLTMADASKPSHLWPYLVEDTYTLRKDFEPARIQPRWLSRSIFALLATCLVALLMFPLATLHRNRPRVAMRTAAGEVTADIGNLDIRPADPALEPNTEIYADPATLRRLADKLAAAQRDKSDNGVSRWMNKARNLASDLQGALTGQQPSPPPPLRLRLTDKNSGSAGGGQSGRPGQSGGQDQRNTPLARSPGKNSADNAGQSPPTSIPGEQADQLARSESGVAAQPGANAANPGWNDSQSISGDASDSGGGSSHGAGSDPTHLFGPPGSQPLGSDSFKITIDAQPSDESSAPGAPAYIPPKVRVPLNSKQYPDEPLARAAVPVADRMTIKRVFER